MNSKPNKPDFLGEQFAARFQDQSVVDRYHLRVTYPPETFRILAELIVDEPRVVLDAGCGTGDVARHLLDYVERIDAVDISVSMMAKGKTLPGGDSPKIRWLFGRMEDVELASPYALITAGQSLHWMDWDVVLPRFGQVLTERGSLAILDVEAEPAPWDDALMQITRQYSINRAYQPYDMIEEFEKRRLFRKTADLFTEPVTFTQPLPDYIEAMHSRSSFSRDVMTIEMAEALDQAVEELLLPYTQDGQITMQVMGHIVWGRPLQPGEESE